MLSAIMTKPDFAEAMFLVAFILFVIVAIIRAMARTIDGTVIAAGFAAVALGLLAL